MGFRMMTGDERSKLLLSLRGNANGQPLYMGKDTSFQQVQANTTDKVPTEEVVNAIKSVSCHYGTFQG